MFCFLFNVYCNNNLYKFKKVDASVEAPFLELRNEEGTILFYESSVTPSQKKIQLHSPYLIQKIRNMKGPIIYTTKKKNYMIYPFDKIVMCEDDREICLGRYTGSFFLDEIYWQSFECGDACDLRKSQERVSTVSFTGMIGELRVDKFYEKRLCEYVFYVGGEELTRKTDNCVQIDYTLVKNNENQSQKNDL